MTIIIFGASGDLSKRKLFPSLSKIDLKNEDIIGYARTNMTTDEFLVKLEEFDTLPNHFKSKIQYVQGQYDKLDELKKFSSPNPIIYFSVPPETYLILLENIKVTFSTSIICIEKPYAANKKDLDKICSFKTDNPNHKVYFIDHYLAKPIIAIMAKLKNDHPFFKEVIHKEYIKHLEIIMIEDLGAEGRSYFIKTGLMKDMVMNHVASMYATLLGANDENIKNFSDEREEVLNKSKIISDFCSFWMYKELEKEENKHLNVETFVCIGLRNSIRKYNGFNIWFISGKGMKKKLTELRMRIKKKHWQYVITAATYKNEKLRDVLREKVRFVDLVFGIYPIKNIYVEVKLIDTVKKKYVLVDENYINETFFDVYGYIGDEHSVIFHCLINKLNFPTANLGEAQRQWELFDVKKLRKHKPLLVYDKGFPIPKVIYDDMKKANAIASQIWFF